MEGKIKIDGNLLAYIMYLADSNEEAELDDTNNIKINNRFIEK